MRFLFTILASLLPFLPSLVHAADCSTYDANMQWFLQSYEYQFWGLRQSACGDNACGSSQVCTLNANSKYGTVQLYRKDVQYEFPNCWDAVSNIITQCDRNWWKFGWWQLGDEFYQMNLFFDFGLKREEGGVDLEEDIKWTFSVEAHNITES